MIHRLLKEIILKYTNKEHKGITLIKVLISFLEKITTIILCDEYYVDQSIDETTSVINIKNNDFNNHASSGISQITLNSKPTDANHTVTKSYVDSLSENERNRRDMSTVFNDADNEFDKNKLTDLGGITIDRNPLLDEEAAN